MIGAALRKVSEEEYLTLLEASEVPLEYVGGYVFRRADSTVTHGNIHANLCYLLGTAARTNGLNTYAVQMRLRIASAFGSTAHYFPDLMVSTESTASDAMFLTAPTLLTEVVSTETLRADAGYKRLDYLNLPSLEGYLLADTTARAVRLYTREGEGWREEYAEGEGELIIPCVGVTLTLADLYDGTNL